MAALRKCPLRVHLQLPFPHALTGVSSVRITPAREILRFAKLASALFVIGAMIHSVGRAGEPDPKSYWDVSQIRPGMKGIGRTVMLGTKLEEFGAEVLGVMRDVSPGRD